LPAAPSRPSPRRLRWAALGALGVLALLLFGLRAGLDLAERRIGVSYDPLSAAGIEVLGLAPKGPAERAGLKAGDILLSIDGQPLHEDADFDRIARGFRRGVPTRIEVTRGEQRLQFVLLPGMTFHWREFALGALACLLYLGLGLLASGQPADPLRATLLAGFCFAVAFELALPSDLAIATGAGLAVQAAFRLITGVQFGLDLHLATVLPTTPRWLARFPWVPTVYYGIGLCLGVVAASALVGEQLGFASFAATSDVADRLMFTWLLPVWAVAVTAIIGRRAFFHETPRGRQQAGLVLLGVLPWFAIVALDSIREWTGQGGGTLPQVVWSFALLFYPVAVFVAIYLYRLFDLELVVRKSLLYGSLTTLLVLGFYGLVAGVGALFAREFGDEGVPLWVLSTAGLTMGLLFNPLRTRLQRVIDRRLFPERQALRSRLVALAAELPAQGKPARMGEHLTRELARIFGVDPVTIWTAVPPQGQLLHLASTRRSDLDLDRTGLVGGEDPAIQALVRSGRPTPAGGLASASPALAQRLGEAGAEIVVPLLAQERLVGLLALGHKREEQRWVAEELELLTLVGHHVATVFENARLFDSATFEGLTGLYRREALLEILDREWSRSQRYDRPLAIAIADLDRFKEVNDQLRPSHRRPGVAAGRGRAPQPAPRDRFHRPLRRRGVPRGAPRDDARRRAAVRRESTPACRANRGADRSRPRRAGDAVDRRGEPCRGPRRCARPSPGAHRRRRRGALRREEQRPQPGGSGRRTLSALRERAPHQARISPTVACPCER
jgi:hypothetical protein